MEQQTADLMHVTDWEGIAFLLKLDPGKVDVCNWNIHPNKDKVNRCLQLCIFKLVANTYRLMAENWISKSEIHQLSWRKLKMRVNTHLISESN